MRRVLLRILVVLVVIVVAAVTGGYWYVRPLLLTGTGYAAHNACALAGLQQRDQPKADLPPNALVPYLNVAPSAEGGSVAIGGLLSRQQAWYAPGYGCTLAAQRPSFDPPTAVSSSGNPLTSAPAATPSGLLGNAVAHAFGDDLDAAGRATLGTRAVLVIHKGRLVAERYADGFTATTPQLGWSMTKTATSLMVGRLVQQGKVALTDTGLRPEWAGDERSKISIEDLLRMTSGLAWDETYDLGTPITRMLYLEPDMGGYVASRPAAHAPGSYQQYSSGSTTLLCDILTDRLGVKADLPRRELFAPLGLSSAVMEPDASGTPVCSSYQWATPRDWAALGQFALQDGVWNGQRMLPEGWMKTTTTAQKVPQTEDPGYAAGWWANQLPDGGVVDPLLPADTYSANGHDGQRVFVVPSAGLVIVRMGFSPGMTGDALRANQLVADVVAALR